jgi:hypothetical protein
MQPTESRLTLPRVLIAKRAHNLPRGLMNEPRLTAKRHTRRLATGITFDRLTLKTLVTPSWRSIISKYIGGKVVTKLFVLVTCTCLMINLKHKAKGRHGKKEKCRKVVFIGQ